jgi:hypothetical protein
MSRLQITRALRAREYGSLGIVWRQRFDDLDLVI